MTKNKNMEPFDQALTSESHHSHADNVVDTTQLTEARAAIKMGFNEWFRTVFVPKFEHQIANFGTAYEVPASITEMPCGCKIDHGDTKFWTIQSEPHDEFVKWYGSQTMLHSACGGIIGEIPTSFMCL